MSGILDNKSRMLDTILTQEGRRQLSMGACKIEFVSFTDAETFYEADAVSGSTDPSNRIFLEACGLPQDQITFEADDSGKLMPFMGGNLNVFDGKVFSGSSDAFLDVITGSTFASLSEQLLDTSINSFSKLYAIMTDDAFFDGEREFKTNTNELVFTITDKVPFKKRDVKDASIDKVESLFQDKRLSNVKNFMYLPPVNKPLSQNASPTPLGSYPVIGQRQSPMTYEQLKSDITGRESITIDFARTTLRSNVFCQLFEMKQHRLLKLDIIDYGEVTVDDELFPTKRIFFAGKVFVDSFGMQTFVNLFTLIYE